MSSIDIRKLTKQWGAVLAVEQGILKVPEGSLTVLLGPFRVRQIDDFAPNRRPGKNHLRGHLYRGKRGDPHGPGQTRCFHGLSVICAVSPSQCPRKHFIRVEGERYSPAERDARLKEAARMVGLADLLDRKPAQLSGGQRQRVALARSIVSRRRVCLMDEPLSNLDAKFRAEMRDDIRTLQQKLNLTMIYVTHDQVEAMTMADQVVLLKAGRIEQTGPPPRAL
jgi:sn-glycerol 3-phosphate transport system ATP-binding protein